MINEPAVLTIEDRALILASMSNTIKSLKEVLDIPSLSASKREKFENLLTKTTILSCYIRSYEGIQLFTK